MSRPTFAAALLLTALTSPFPANAQDLAQGPFDRMVIRGVTIIDGTGGPPEGPFDVVIENDRIAELHLVGDDFGRIDEASRPAPGDFDLDAQGQFLMPGFIDAHVHMGGPELTGLPMDYYYYLMLGHGITTVLEAGSGNGVEWTLEQKRASDAHEIVAPRILAYVRPGMAYEGPVETPEQARAWVQAMAALGADGLKLSSHPPEIMAALIDEAHAHGMQTTAHLAQGGSQRGTGIRNSVTRMNLVDAARLGLDHQQHWYGLPESMLETYTVPPMELDYNYNNEQDRFRDAGRFWNDVEPGSEKWYGVMDELLELDLTIIPTMAVYERNRDLQRVREAPWHEAYASPRLRASWDPDPGQHGSRYYNWTSEYEANWWAGFAKWQRFLNEYKNRGGRVGTGADEGNAYNLFAFGYVRELELLRQSGFHPLEVIRAATLATAEGLGMAENLGTVEVGKTADFAIVGENPLVNLKVLYGTGTQRYDPDADQMLDVGGVTYSVKDGVVYDAKALLAEVRRMVREQASPRADVSN
jgi:imidazolonepropionase-like amidohydrolase